MPNLIKLEKISLKNNPVVKEDLIQNFIFNDPTVLNLGELTPIQREKIQPSGGRLDILLSDDNGTRYEVEVQLGATDPSHIIRTIEYWDLERKRYPQYDHCAVIVAEEITGRFMNVISLFNGSIPLIALQMTAYKSGNDIILTFTKVIDRIILATDDEEFEITDRNYWENRSTPKMMKIVDNIFDDLNEYVNGYELKYNKFYIGLTKDGIARNFIYFKPKKNYIYLGLRGNENEEIINIIEKSGLDVNYQAKWKEYKIKLTSFDEYKNNKDLISKLIKESLDYYNIAE